MGREEANLDRLNIRAGSGVKGIGNKHYVVCSVVLDFKRIANQERQHLNYFYSVNSNPTEMMLELLILQGLKVLLGKQEDDYLLSIDNRTWSSLIRDLVMLTRKPFAVNCFFLKTIKMKEELCAHLH